MSLPDERDRVQKKTFTKWVNKHLIKVGGMCVHTCACVCVRAHVAVGQGTWRVGVTRVPLALLPEQGCPHCRPGSSSSHL